MIKLDEATLLAYVDGTLDVARVRDVEDALATDAAAREMVDRLRATPPSLREVFDATLTRPLPPRFAETILRRRLGRAPRLQLRYPHAAVAALILFVVGLGAGFAVSDWQRSRSSSSDASWIAAVVDYQVLYGRETLNRPDASVNEKRQTEQRLTRQLGHPVAVPDLASFGLAFKRGQLLDFHGEPVVQLAYLPASGKPIAYCITRDDGANTAPKFGRDKGLAYLQWREAGYGHILIGAVSDSDLTRMVDAIRTGKAPAT